MKMFSFTLIMAASTTLFAAPAILSAQSFSSDSGSSGSLIREFGDFTTYETSIVQAGATLPFDRDGVHTTGVKRGVDNTYIIGGTAILVGEVGTFSVVFGASSYDRDDLKGRVQGSLTTGGSGLNAQTVPDARVLRQGQSATIQLALNGFLIGGTLINVEEPLTSLCTIVSIDAADLKRGQNGKALLEVVSPTGLTLGGTGDVQGITAFISLTEINKVPS